MSSTHAAATPIDGADPRLYNEDLAPTAAEGRTWKWTSIAALWVGMVVCVPTYMLAAGMIKQGMSWKQAVLTVLAGQVIVLIPMMLVGHAGTKYGIPFPVLLRSSFGTVGAKADVFLALVGDPSSAAQGIFLRAKESKGRISIYLPYSYLYL